MKKKQNKTLKLTYVQATDTPPEEAQRRLARAYDILFDEMLKKGYPIDKWPFRAQEDQRSN